MNISNPLLKTALVTSFSILSAGALASHFPDKLPTKISQGGGALIGDEIYIGLGSAGVDFFKFDLTKEGNWEKIAPFPAGERLQPVVASVDGKLFVFGGLQKNEKGELQLVNDAHCYDPKTNEWTKLPTRSPLGLVGATGAVHDGKIYIIGGSNLSIFNGYFQDYVAAGDNDEAKQAVANAYFNQRPQDYFFNTTLFSYQPATNQWRNEGALPFSGRAGAAVAVKDNTITVINGEIKPGLRTAETEQGTFNADGGVDWTKLPNLPPEKSGEVQDGLAGAYIGYVDGHLQVAGGANFPGSTKQFSDGKLKAHDGLKKTYHSGIYTLKDDGSWVVNEEKLPVGAGYGVSMNYGNTWLILGGENGDGALDQVVQFGSSE